MAEIAVAECKTADDVRALVRRIKPAPKAPVVRLCQPHQSPKPVIRPVVEEYIPPPMFYDREHSKRWSALRRAFRMTPTFEMLCTDTPKTNKQLSMTKIATVLCDHFSITVTELRSERRTLCVVYPRQLFCFIVKKNTVRGLAMIGRWLNRDHTTVLHATRKITALCQPGSRVAADVAEIERRLFWESNNG